MTAPFLSLRHVAKRFASHHALTDVSMEVAAGEIAVVIGPSGCGKTTLLRLIAGLDAPDTGEIWLDQALVAAAGRVLVPPYRRGIGFVFQDLALWPHLSVRGNLAFVLESARVPPGERTSRITEALRLVRIEPLAGRHPHQLSGGEQQRVALARALVASPRVLLLDEPLSSLDPDLRAAMRTELARLQRTLRVTAIYVTHDREDAASLADVVIEMREGSVVGVGPRKRLEERA